MCRKPTWPCVESAANEVLCLSRLCSRKLYVVNKALKTYDLYTPTPLCHSLTTLSNVKSLQMIQHTAKERRPLNCNKNHSTELLCGLCGFLADSERFRGVQKQFFRNFRLYFFPIQILINMQIARNRTFPIQILINMQIAQITNTRVNTFVQPGLPVNYHGAQGFAFLTSYSLYLFFFVYKIRQAGGFNLVSF